MLRFLIRSFAASSAQALYTTLRTANTLTPDLLARLAAAVKDELSVNPSVLYQHGKDESFHSPMPPLAVVFPSATNEVQDIMRICYETHTPLVPFGGGTSLESHIGSFQNGVSLDLSKMNRVLEINAPDLYCKVEAGVTRKQLNEHVRQNGVFFPVDPGADATLGGMTATRASGTNAVRYGTMRENVLGMTVVLADGQVAILGRPVKKSSAGYDLTHLMVGSEGTLGIITEITLRLYPLPETVSAAVCEFPDIKSAVDAVTAIMQCSIPVARLELIDDVCIRAVNNYSNTSFTPTPTLFLEFHGTPLSVKEQVEAVRNIITDYKGGEFKWADTPEERTKLWSARHTAYWASLNLRPGCRGFPTDVCVPVSQLSRCILESKQEIEDAGLLAPMVGHVGDGNFHMMLIVDPKSDDEMLKAQTVVDNMVKRSLRLGGTSTGEHGIGHHKLKYLRSEHGTAPVEMMHAIKRALDPKNILNPCKLGSEPEYVYSLK